MNKNDAGNLRKPIIILSGIIVVGLACGGVAIALSLLTEKENLLGVILLLLVSVTFASTGIIGLIWLMIRNLLRRKKVSERDPTSQPGM
jgi:uncharacterized membrane protein YqjE